MRDKRTITGTTTHGLAQGDRIHIEGQAWTVTSVTSTTFTIRRPWWRRALDAVTDFFADVWSGLRAFFPRGDQ